LAIKITTLPKTEGVAELSSVRLELVEAAARIAGIANNRRVFTAELKRPFLYVGVWSLTCPYEPQL
jgi:hypothetical protein